MTVFATPRIHLSTGNAKLQKTAKLHNARITSFDLVPGVTCPCAGECKDWCYAQKGNYVRFGKTLGMCHEENYEISQRADFVDIMVKKLRGMVKAADRKGKKVFIRLHATGDFYSLEYARKWAEIARQCPSVTFYAYTKSVSIVQRAGFPKNVFIAYSYGGTQDLQIPEGATVARVFQTEEEALNAGYNVNVNGDDLQVVAGGKLGLIYH